MIIHVTLQLFRYTGTTQASEKNGQGRRICFTKCFLFKEVLNLQ